MESWWGWLSYVQKLRNHAKQWDELELNEDNEDNTNPNLRLSKFVYSESRWMAALRLTKMNRDMLTFKLKQIEPCVSLEGTFIESENIW